MNLPSQLQLRPLTLPKVGLESVRRQTQSVVSHSEIKASEPPIARYLPFGEYAIEVHDEVWAIRLCMVVREGKLRMLTVPSLWVKSTSASGLALEKQVWFV